MLRGGYRYVWGDYQELVLPAEDVAEFGAGEAAQNVSLGSIHYRASQKLAVTAEAEVASSGGAYFRTSLYNYQKVRAQAHSTSGVLASGRGIRRAQ